MNLAPHVPENITTDALRVGRAATPGNLTLSIESVTVAWPRGNAVIEIAAAGVNASDVKAVLGAMPHAIWPRTPGRDYSGVVVDGPADLIGKEVWGSGGELGIRRDGTHARHLVIDASYIRAKPSTLSLQEAGAVGVPFITAYEGLREAGGFTKATLFWCLEETARLDRPRSSSPRWRASHKYLLWSARPSRS
jgi:NADPH:quinone reductase-like Zn-dependent oxidoreductase